MKKINLFLLSMTIIALFLSCSGNDIDDSVKDLEKPTITDEGIVAMPENCQTYKPGEKIPVRYILKDNIELGRYNIEIHNNFDHHSHSTSAGDCPLDPKKTANDKVWIFNQDFTIPSGCRTFTIHQDIDIPTDRQPGDYHFVIRFTDKAGHQDLKAISIKLIAPAQ